MHRPIKHNGQKLFKLLRAKMAEKGHDQIDLAKLLDRSLTYISLRFCGHMPWDMDDVYRMCLIYNIPHSEIHLYFPKDGIDEPQLLASNGNDPKQSTYKSTKREKELLMEKLLTIEEYIYFRKSKEQINEFEINKRGENTRRIIGFVLDFF
jgi:hypothetical protein